ncbi:PAP2 family phosphoesterase [Desulfuromonas versatilis]|uniref:PAP2 family phosphoesterase n=1 Tax=Desulfuromonas versatilis TaxID=2802975 RepID=A0ABN6E2F6_9BACT|nr:phosphatase PAP2 family protein [Desulfuromonas versatilis]BCR06352.1 PAP2 family phosphoesterase [Desulfuromonas versatilis]
MSERANLDHGFWLWHAGLPLLLFGALAAVFELSDWDLILSDRFFDAARGGWYLKHSWWADGLIHRGGKYLVLATALGALGLWLGSYRWAELLRFRHGALFMVLCIALGTGLVAAGKATINRHCPWDYQRYGGKVPYVRLFESPVPGHKTGHGFPAGHASGGFALTGSYFLFRRRRPRLALLGLGAGLALGGVFGFGQLVRGAHFASHNLYSVILCWLVSLGLYAGGFSGRLHPPQAQGEAARPRGKIPAP